MGIFAAIGSGIKSAALAVASFVGLIREPVVEPILEPGLEPDPWVTVSPFKSVHERKVRLYAVPHWLRTGDQWREIDKVVAVARSTKTGAYRVTLDEDWIEFTPTPDVKAATIKTAVSVRCFGDIVDAEALTDPVVEYNVTYSEGVEPVAMGWKFAKAEGCDVGLFLTDWQCRFGERQVALVPSRAVLDLSAHLAKLDADGVLATASINLDPTTILADTIYEYFSDGLGFDDWDTVRLGEGLGVTRSEHGVQSLLGWSGSPFNELRRLVAVMASEVPAVVSSCYLYVFGSGAAIASLTFLNSSWTLNSQDDYDDWVTITTDFTTFGSVNREYVSFPATYRFNIKAALDGGGMHRDTFILALTEDYDNSEPAASKIGTITNSSTYIEYEVPPLAETGMIIGSGIVAV